MPKPVLLIALVALMPNDYEIMYSLNWIIQPGLLASQNMRSQINKKMEILGPLEEW